MKKNHKIVIKEKNILKEGLRGKWKRYNTGLKDNVAGYFKSIYKIAGKTKNLAKEYLDINKISKRKIHKVDEKINGKWVDVHNEDKSL